MLNILIPVMIIGIVMGACVAMISYGIALGRLVSHQHAMHHAAWERDGCWSVFFFRRPPGAKMFPGMILQSPLCGWLFATPHWAEGDSVALKLLARTRRYAAASVLAYVAAMFTTWIYMAMRHNI